MRILTAVTAALFLASCHATPEEIAAEDHAKCVELGFQPKTEAYGDCRLALMQLDEQRRQANAAAYQSGLATQDAILRGGGWR